MSQRQGLAQCLRDRRIPNPDHCDPPGSWLVRCNVVHCRELRRTDRSQRNRDRPTGGECLARDFRAVEWYDRVVSAEAALDRCGQLATGTGIGSKDDDARHNPILPRTRRRTA